MIIAGYQHVLQWVFFGTDRSGYSGLRLSRGAATHNLSSFISSLAESLNQPRVIGANIVKPKNRTNRRPDPDRLRTGIACNVVTAAQLLDFWNNWRRLMSPPLSVTPCSACSVLSPSLLGCLHDFIHVRRGPNLKNVAVLQGRMLRHELYSMIMSLASRTRMPPSCSLVSA